MNRLGYGSFSLATLCGIVALSGCATPAVVFVSSDYAANAPKRVTLAGFSDFPGQSGSGSMIASIFEKYLFKLQYQVVDPNQGSNTAVDAVVSGSISELTNTSEETVMVDIPQLETEPTYQDVVVPGRHGLRNVTEQTGTQTVVNDQVVPQTETLPARVGLTVRMVGSKSGNVLWTGSASADGMDIASAAEEAASKVIDALQKSITHASK